MKNRVWIYLKLSFHQIKKLLSVETFRQLIRRFSSLPNLPRLPENWAMNEGLVHRGQPTAVRCLAVLPSVSDRSTGHTKPISEEA